VQELLRQIERTGAPWVIQIYVFVLLISVALLILGAMLHEETLRTAGDNALKLSLGALFGALSMATKREFGESNPPQRPERRRGTRNVVRAPSEIADSADDGGT
jgi:hypothetical protein